RRVQLDDASLLDHLDKARGATITDGDLRAIDVDFHIVDPNAAQSRHQVLDRQDDSLSLLEGRAPVGARDIFGNGLDGGLTGKIDAAKEDARVALGRSEERRVGKA